MMTSREEIIEAGQHAFMGLMLEAWAKNREGAAQALWFRQIGPRVEVMLGAVVDRAVKACLDEQAQLNKPSESRELFGAKKGKANNHE